jgi:hypothetical protein
MAGRRADARHDGFYHQGEVGRARYTECSYGQLLRVRVWVEFPKHCRVGFKPTDNDVVYWPLCRVASRGPTRPSRAPLIERFGSEAGPCCCCWGVWAVAAAPTPAMHRHIQECQPATHWLAPPLLVGSIRLAASQAVVPISPRWQCRQKGWSARNGPQDQKCQAAWGNLFRCKTP